MFNTVWQQYFGGLQQAISRRGVRGGMRRRKRPEIRIETLETRVLLSANVEAKLLGGSLFLNGASGGARSLQVTQDTVNPALFNVIPGAGTTVNGLTTPAQFLVSQLSRDIVVSMNNGLAGKGGTSLSFNGSGLTIRGNVTVNVLGQGADTIHLQDAGMGGSLFVNTNDGADQLSLSNLRVGQLTNLTTGAGRDAVVVEKSTFSGSFNLDGGVLGGDSLKVDDSTFQQSFSANLWTSGNTINVERDTALPGQTTFNGPASFNYLGVLRRGGGGNINVGLQNPNTQVEFRSMTTFLAGNVRTSVTATHFSPCAPCFIYCTRVGVEITTASLPGWTQNRAGYSQTITTDGGTGPLTFSVSSGALPAGLVLNPATGVISGTPTTVGTSVFTVLVADANGPSASQPYSVVINAPVQITTTSLVPWTKDQGGYSQPIATTGGTAPLTFTVSAGTLPAGLILNPSTGVLSGTPTAAGDSSFTVLVTDTAGATDTQDYTVTINPVVAITTTSLPGWTLNSNLPDYSQTVAAAGGTGAITFGVVTGSLPAGLILGTTTGEISGTPTTEGTFTFTVGATDSVGAVGTKQFTIVIYAAITITTTSLPNGTRDVDYSSGPIATVGGSLPVTFSLQAGLLPTGFSLNPATGEISGNTSEHGLIFLTIQATDSLGGWDWQLFSLLIA